MRVRVPGPPPGRGARRAGRRRLPSGRSVACRSVLGGRPQIDLAPESGPDRIAVVLVDLIVLVGQQAEPGGVAQQFTVDPVRDARVLRRQLLEVGGVGEPVGPAAGEDLADLEGVAADGGDVLLAVGPALLGAGELGEGGQGRGLGGLADRPAALDPALVGRPAQGGAGRRRLRDGAAGTRGPWPAAWARPSPARSLGVGTPLEPTAPGSSSAAGAPSVPAGGRETPLAPLRSRACSTDSGPVAAAAAAAAAATADSGSGAERIAAISGRGTGGGAQGPPSSLARTARVIQVRSSTRRSSASATRSSDWL